MNKVINIYHIYVALWIGNQLQSFYYNSSSLSLLFSVPFMGITLYYIFRTIMSKYVQRTIRILSVFIILLMVYGVLNMIPPTTIFNESKSFIMMAINSMGPIIPFYHFTKKGLVTERSIISYFVIFLIISTINYFITQQRTLLIAIEKGTRFDEITNNSTYLFVGLIPFIFFLKKIPFLQYIAWAYIFFFTISSMKRGALVCFVVMFIWFLYISVDRTNIRRLLSIFFLSFVFIYAGLQFSKGLYKRSIYMQFRVEETLERNDSKRSDIYMTLWEHYINNDNNLQKICGEGPYSTQDYTEGLSAHNDWLEILIDMGIIGLFCYLIYWISFVRSWITCRKENLIYALLGSCFFYGLLRSLFSMSFSDMPFFVCLIMGYAFAHIAIKEKSSLTFFDN